MKENLIAYHKPSMYYEDIETMLILALNPPLNLDKNDSPVNAGFREHLKDLCSRRPALQVLTIPRIIFRIDINSAFLTGQRGLGVGFP